VDYFGKAHKSLLGDGGCYFLKYFSFRNILNFFLTLTNRNDKKNKNS